MTESRRTRRAMAWLLLGSVGVLGCRDSMPHSLTWPGGGDLMQSHAKPPEGGYYSDWDPFSVELVLTPAKDVNPVQTQHVLVATVNDKDGRPLPNRRVEWIIGEGSVGDIIEVDESGWRNSRGYKVDNHYAVSHTNNFDHLLDMGTDDPSDDVQLTKGQTWCIITSPIEGDTHIIAYAPGIYDRSKHKVFAVKHWYDVAWEFPPPATNPTGTTHEFTTVVTKYSDGSPLAGYIVNYEILDGPDAVFESSGRQTASGETDEAGTASVTIRQTQPLEGTNSVQIDVIRPADEQCCIPAKHIATGRTAKTWVGPKIAISKDAPAQKLINEEFNYAIVVSNPSEVTATSVVVTDVLPEGIAYVSSSPSANVSGQTLSWSLGELGARDSRSLSVTVKGTRTGTFENCADVRADMGLSARDCASTTISAPQIALEKECTAEVLICDPIQITLTVKNTGDGTATNVQIEDRLPEGLVTENGRTGVRVNVGTLGPGEMRQSKFTAQAQRTGTFTNTATVTADGGLSEQVDCQTVVRQPVLAVTKSGPEERFLGRPAQYEITVTNSGDAPARDTLLTEDIPAGTEFIEAGQGGRQADRQVVWNLGTLEPGASETVTLTLRATQPGSIRNTATAKAYCAEATGSATMVVRGIPAVLLEVIDLEDPNEIGTTETYVITVTNQGSAEATNIRVIATVQPEAEYVSSDGPTAGAVDGRTVTFAPLPRLDPQAVATYRVTVKSLEAGDTRFKVTMTNDQLTGPPVEETESTRFY